MLDNTKTVNDLFERTRTLELAVKMLGAYLRKLDDQRFDALVGTDLRELRDNAADEEGVKRAEAIASLVRITL